MVSYLADKGPRVLANGFNIIPILPGEKRPSIKDWQKTERSEAQLGRWVSNGRASHGVGILTRLTPGADLDISHRPTLRKLLDRVETRLGFAPTRVGNPPKRLLLFKLKGEPFAKINSREYCDPDGNKAKVEILSDGEQFVAYHIHPDTHKPYRWLHEWSPETITVDELIGLAVADGQWIVDEFQGMMEELNWPLWSATKTQLRTYENPDDDPFGLGHEPIGLGEDKLRAMVEAIPNDGAPYDGQGLTWLNILAAVHNASTLIAVKPRLRCQRALPTATGRTSSG